MKNDNPNKPDTPNPTPRPIMAALLRPEGLACGAPVVSAVVVKDRAPSEDVEAAGIGDVAKDEESDPGAASTCADDAMVVGVGVAADVVDGTDAASTVSAGNAPIGLDGGIENKNKSQ
jgi:hypothetical protein